MSLKVEMVKKKSPLRILTRNTDLENDSRITRRTKNVLYLQVSQEEELKEFKQAEICLVQHQNILFSKKGKKNNLENSIQDDDEYKKFMQNPEINLVQEDLELVQDSTPLLEFIKNRKLKKELYLPKKEVKKKKKNSKHKF
jgi:hypothetical protein